MKEEEEEAIKQKFELMAGNFNEMLRRQAAAAHRRLPSARTPAGPEKSTAVSVAAPVNLRPEDGS